MTVTYNNPTEELDAAIAAATEAAHNANAAVARSLGLSPAPLWIDATDEQKANEIAVARDVCGLPSTLTPESNIAVGNVGLFVNTVRSVVVALGYAPIVKLPIPVFVPAAPAEPDTAPEATSDATTPEPEDFPNGKDALDFVEDPDEGFDWGDPFTPEDFDIVSDDELEDLEPPKEQTSGNDSAGQPAGANGQ